MAMNFKIPFFLHDLGVDEVHAFAEALQSPILTTGELVARFENQFASYLGQNHAIGVTSCTAALHLALLGLDIGPGDEVITTPMTFIATSTAILQAGAKPVLVDVEPDTGNLDANAIERVITKKTKAIVPVHLYGLMCDMRALRAIADQHGLKVIEDCAHCIEGSRDGIRPGELGDAACFSFFATKNITCGEGGAVTTNDPVLAKRLRLLRSHGMTATSSDRFKDGYKPWDMEIFGWKYNMSNLQAAILLPQMKRITANFEKRQSRAKTYVEALAAIKGVRMPATRPNSVHARHLFTIWLTPPLRDKAISELTREGIGITVNYQAIHLTSYLSHTLGYKAGDFPIAERIGSETLSLPFYPNLSDENIETVARRLHDIIER